MTGPLRVVSVSGAAQAVLPDPTPAAAETHARHLALAEVAAVYAGLIGGDVQAGDLTETLLRLPDGMPALDAVQAALSAHGMRACPVAALSELPAILELGTGDVVLALAADENWVEVYDPTRADLTRSMARADVMALVTGRAYCGRVEFAVVERRHATAAPRHWFWGEFRGHLRAFVEVGAASLVANLLSAGIAMYSLQIYDRVIPHQSEPTLWVLSVGVLIAILFDSLLRVARAGLMDVAGRRIEMTVQATLMRRLLGARAGNTGERRPSQTFGAMREFGAVREFFTASTIGTLADLPFIVIFLALVASIGGEIVWVLVAGGLLMVLPGLLFQSRMVRLTHEMQGAGNRTAKLLFEAVHDHETLTTQRGEARFQRLWDELVALMALKSSQQRNLTTALTTWAGAVQQGTNIVAVMIGTYQVFAGNYTVGTIIAIGMLSSRTLAPLSQLSAMVVRWTNVKAALTALDAIAAAPQSEDAGTRYLRRETFAGTYEMQRCAFRYDPQGALALDLPALSIPAGQHVAVLGANGSGKSTLLRVMAGLALPETGRVLLDGCDLAQISMRDLRRGVGYLGQEVRLFSGTLRDNLNLTQIERDDARLMAALDFAGLGAFLRGHPRGLDLEIAEGGLGLSVGQRQSLGWARLWLQDPTVVLLDEPTAAMDQTLEAMMVRRLGPWLRGRTAIIATHRVPLLQLVSRTVILQSGRIAVDGPRDEVLARLAQAQGAQVAQVAG